MRWTIDQWRALDWTKPNRVLAAECGKSIATVTQMRWRLDSGAATQKAPINYQPSSATALEQHANTTAWIEGVAATVKNWLLISPDGRQFSARNLRQFVRDHANEFAPEDVVWDSVGRGGGKCRAVNGIYHAARTATRWKGWSASQAG